MIYKEEVRDLFSVPDDYYLAHCISADFGMGKGIAVEFNKRFDMKNRIMRLYPGGYGCHDTVGCVLIDKVLNLITKENYWDKPTYHTIMGALYHMREICVDDNINKIAMPLIGCGLDKLSWDRVSAIIKKTFESTDIEILICKIG